MLDCETLNKNREYDYTKHLLLFPAEILPIAVYWDSPRISLVESASRTMSERPLD